MSGPNLIARVVEIFQSGATWWTNKPTLIERERERVELMQIEISISDIKLNTTTTYITVH